MRQTKRKLRNIHPGEVLCEEFLIPLGVTRYRLAKEVCVTEARISAICSGKRAITANAIPKKHDRCAGADASL